MMNLCVVMNVRLLCDMATQQSTQQGTAAGNADVLLLQVSALLEAVSNYWTAFPAYQLVDMSHL